MRESVPEGFEQMPRGFGFIDCLQPLYRRVEGRSGSIGLVVEHHHANSRGVCHGGVLATLADIAAAMGVGLARGAADAAPTLNLALDFISSARVGQWLQADTQQVTVKRRIGFCSGVISTREILVARFNGTFYFPDLPGG